jgi:hypothetical protein
MAALGLLFPEAPASVPVSAPWRAARAAVQVAVACAAAVALLYRIAGIPAWDCLYAEDNGVFLVGALARPWHLLVPYAGYEELMPRLIGQLAAYLPLADAAFTCAVAGAAVAALCALFIYHASEGHVRSPWLRALLGAALILAPLSPIEIADSGVNTPWYALAAAFFGLVWRPRTRAGMAAAALVAFAASSSAILAAIYAPLVLTRLAVLPRWREHAVTAGWAAGLLVQVPVVLATYTHHTPRLGRMAAPGDAVGFYLHNVVLRALGWRLSAHLVSAAGENGATAIVGAALAVAAGWAVAQRGPARAFAIAAMATGFAATVFAATVVPYVTHQPVRYNPLSFEGGSRFATVPVMLLDALAIVAADACLRRQVAGRAGRRALAVATAGAVAVACVLASGWVADYRYATERTTSGYWAPQARAWLEDCARGRDGQVTLPAWEGRRVTVECSRLRR